jgi:flagellar operon protein
MKPEDLTLQTKLQPLRPIQPKTGPSTPGTRKTERTDAFSKVFAGELASKSEAAHPQRTTSGLEFSAHALNRLQERNVRLTHQGLERLDHGVQLAEQKGSVNTLVLMDDTAFIVSVKNRKVVTAITRDGAVDNVFTQIDSAAIV